MKQITKNILTLTQELMHYRSDTSNQKICFELLTFIQGKLSVSSEILENNGVYSLIAKNFSGKSADVVLNGHVDVVSCEDDQRASTVDGDKLYGRGSGDMKAGVALIITLFNEIIENSIRGNYMLLLTSDEEIGGFDGVAWLCSQGYRGDVVLIPDGGSTNSVVIGSKGVVTLGISGVGKGAHASRPRLGDTIHDDFIVILNKIRGKLHKATKEDHWGTSVVLTECSLGHARNALPESLDATIDIRFTQEHSIESIVAFVDELIDQHKGFTKTVLATGNLVYGDEHKNGMIQYYKECLESVIGDVFLVKEDGGSDGRHFAAHGSTVILHRPTCENIHAEGEWCSISGIEKVYEAYKLFIVGYIENSSK